MKKLNELSPYEVLTLTNLITKNLFDCFDECEYLVIKQICSNIISQICLMETQCKCRESHKEFDKDKRPKL